MAHYKKNGTKLNIIILCGLLAVIFYIWFDTAKITTTSMAYTDFLEHLENDRVASVQLSDGPKLFLQLNNEDNIRYTVDNPRSEGFKEKLMLHNIDIVEKNSSDSSSMLLSLSIIGVSLFVCYRLYQSRPGTEMAAVSASEVTQETASKTTFDNIAGNDEVKENIRDLVDFIQNPEKYKRYGARIPRGVIFYGPPGTGKTLMAKAIAGEAGVPFFAVSGSDFVQMYVGVGAARVRELFSKARKSEKAVVFIDEIDAVGKKRSGNTAGGSDEKDQTLNALLTEMSGFNENEGIIVIAATNRIEMLDEALLRPGRFDRQEEIGLPDLAGRHGILKLHAKNKLLCETVDLKALAKQTVYFSGAMLENFLNEAAITAAKREAQSIELEDIDKAYYTIVAGSEKKDRSGIFELDRRITAYHEAGHALVTKLTSPQNTVAKVTIIPSSKGAGGFSVNIPPDKFFYTKRELENQIMISLAGRAAEELIFGADDITTGASNDIEKATTVLRDYITKYGMSEKTGLISIDILAGQRGIDQNALIEQGQQLMWQFYDRTKQRLAQNMDLLTIIAEKLLEVETLSEEELDSLLEGNQQPA